MNNKEAIEFRTIIKILEGIRLRLKPYNYERGSISRNFSRDDYKSIDKVIELLQRGEKHEKMWKELYEIASEFNFFPLMDKVKQEYFPKGESSE